ncbi:carbon-nitrogen hydrolase family protein [Clostridium sp. BJN0001]|uniref:carbon-nitrogen hydrolase family protein n=1 Tax=Clostridium sp. BJN0001 TaxID=2930219 RepID=UPI001FD60566|nr:carbon-nitrogen hydrolase family protein [Clostridium sp. BJN0001]
MKIGFMQFDVKHNSKENINVIDSLINNNTADLWVLPELCTSGYLFKDKNELKQFAQEINNSSIVNDMKKISKKHNCAIIFGMPELENNKIYNTAVIVDNNKYIGKYRKIHLSDLEKKLFSRGKENKVFDVRGIKIGVQICFDLWFPEISREQILQGANLLCALSNFGGNTSFDIARIRAIENLTPLVLCNRVGNENLSNIDAYFLGKSTIFDKSGTKLTDAIKNEVIVSISEIETSNLKSNIICSNFEKEINFHHLLNKKDVIR